MNRNIRVLITNEKEYVMSESKAHLNKKTNLSKSRCRKTAINYKKATHTKKLII